MGDQEGFGVHVRSHRLQGRTDCTIALFLLSFSVDFLHNIQVAYDSIGPGYIVYGGD